MQPISRQLPESGSRGLWDFYQHWAGMPWLRRGLALAISAILLTSAFLKAQELASHTLAPGDVFQNRWLILVVVEWEFVLAAWLLSNVFKRAAWLAVTGTFCGFLAVTFFRALSGAQSCGCFGRIQVNPWITLCLDATILTLLLVLHPHWIAEIRGQWRVKRVVAAGLCVALVGTLSAVGCVRNDAPAGVLENADVGQQDRLVVLNPNEWLGQPFPLSSYVTLDQPVMQGCWIAVLYHHDCEHCQVLLAKLRDQVRQHPPGAGDPPLAAIEMPPFVKDGGVPAVAAIPGVHNGRLSAAHDWFVDTPVVVALRDGRVLFAEQKAGFEAIEQARRAISATEPKLGQGGTEIGRAGLYWYCSETAKDDDSWFSRVQPGKDVPVVGITGSLGVHSFGKVAGGSVHAVYFELHNRGSEPLRVSGVRSECACLHARPETQVIAPGGTGRLLIGYRAPQAAGPYKGRLLVAVKDAGPILLTLRAEVHAAPAAWESGNLYLSRISLLSDGSGRILTEVRGSRQVE